MQQKRSSIDFPQYQGGHQGVSIWRQDNITQIKFGSKCKRMCIIISSKNDMAGLYQYFKSNNIHRASHSVILSSKSSHDHHRYDQPIWTEMFYYVPFQVWSILNDRLFKPKHQIYLRKTTRSSLSEQQHEKVSQAGDRGLLRSHKAGKVTKLAVAGSIEGVYNFTKRWRSHNISSS